MEILQVEFIPYAPTPVRSLKVVHSNEIQYQHKFENRDALNHLFTFRDHCDDVLIIKNGFVTDSSYCNVIFSDGKDWFTPHPPLLEGTMRKFLLNEGLIKEARIHVENITDFKAFKLVNAMLGNDGPELSISQIVF